MNIKRISIVVPVKDEQDTLESLFHQCNSVTSELGAELEMIFVDDGSSDNSWEVMRKLHADNPENVKLVKLRKNCGKAFALSAGFECVTGEVIFTMDADLQDDPNEIPKFLEKLDEGFACVSGWKVNRQDPKSKTIPSKLFNWVTAKLSGISLHDFNCGFKAYKAEVVDKVQVYGELHRYIPILAQDYGYRIAEVEVRHHPREHGSSKYGWERYTRGLVDLITVMATTRYLSKPGHLYGGIGVLFGILGSLILSYLAVIWLMGFGPVGTRPLFFVGILFVILSIQLLSLGVLAEIIVRSTTPLGKVNKLISEKHPPDSPKITE
ncbi:MAG: glycosyltransferase family 2 protein [Halioglobus sp.]|nr:glycosyltransferase family 2 protein [Halioglobus sp.]